MELLKKLKDRIRPFFYSNRHNEFINNGQGINLNLGCGIDYLEGWINVDNNINLKVDLISDFMDLDSKFKINSVDKILLVHSISYLRLWEGIEFLQLLFKILKKDGILVLEFPDVLKCSKALYRNKTNLDKYSEIIRTFYAYDMDQIKNREIFKTYSFGWSSMHMKHELKKIGFSEVNIYNPCTHGKLHWRDSRVEAKK